MIQPQASSNHLAVYHERRQKFSDQLNVLGFVNPPFCLQLIVDQYNAVETAKQAKEINYDEAYKCFNEIAEAIKTFEERTRNHPLSTKVDQIKSDLQHNREGDLSLENFHDTENRNEVIEEVDEELEIIENTEFHLETAQAQPSLENYGTENFFNPRVGDSTAIEELKSQMDEMKNNWQSFIDQKVQDLSEIDQMLSRTLGFIEDIIQKGKDAQQNVTELESEISGLYKRFIKRFNDEDASDQAQEIVKSYRKLFPNVNDVILVDPQAIRPDTAVLTADVIARDNQQTTKELIQGFSRIFEKFEGNVSNVSNYDCTNISMAGAETRTQKSITVNAKGVDEGRDKDLPDRVQDYAPMMLFGVAAVTCVVLGVVMGKGKQ
jgi:tetratricopeptide (TPR) repeat protein